MAAARCAPAENPRTPTRFGSMPHSCACCAHQSHCALRILQCGGGFGIRARVRHAIFEQHAGHAGGVQPVADFGPFKIDRQNAVAAPGKNDNGGVRSAGALGAIERKRRHGDVSKAHQRTTGNQIVLGRCCVGFRRKIRRRAGRSSGPHVHGELTRWRRPSGRLSGKIGGQSQGSTYGKESRSLHHRRPGEKTFER